MKVVELERTCGSCPSQWEGRLDDGRAIYVHFRGGRMSVGLGETIDDAVDATLDGTALYPEVDLDGGWMDDETMRGVLLAAGILA